MTYFQKQFHNIVEAQNESQASDTFFSDKAFQQLRYKTIFVQNTAQCHFGNW